MDLLNRPVIQHVFDSITADHFLTPKEAASLTTPTLLIWGQSERILPKACLTWFKAHLPACARIVEPHNYGHSPHLEQPRDFARRIVSFAHEVMGQRVEGYL